MLFRSRSVVSGLAVASEMDDRPIAATHRVFFDDVVDQKRIAAWYIGGSLRIDEVKFAIRRIVNVIADDEIQVRPTLDIVPRNGSCNLTISYRNARPAEIKIVIKTGVIFRTVICNRAFFDDLPGTAAFGDIAVAHHSHIVLTNDAVSDRYVVRLIDAHSGPVMAFIPGVDECESVQYATGGSWFELDDGTRHGPSAGINVTTTVQNDRRFSVSGSDRQRSGPNHQYRLPVGRTIALGMHDDFVAGLCLGNGVFDPLEYLAVADLKRCGGGGNAP